MADQESISNKRIYDQMIAGCVPATGMNKEDAVSKMAANIFAEQRLHIVWCEQGDFIYFFAVPSKFITHAESFATPLAAALPVHPQHQGDGIYVFPEILANLAVIKRTGEMILATKSQVDIEQLAQEYGLKVFQINEGAEFLPLVSVYGRQRLALERLASRIARASLRASTVSLIVYVVTVLGLSQHLVGWASQWASKRAVAETVQKLQYTSPLTEKLAHFQQVTGVVVRAGGWLNGYVWKQGEEAFEISFPGWISHDYVDALGADTVADYNIPDNLVLARKGNLEALSKR